MKRVLSFVIIFTYIFILNQLFISSIYAESDELIIKDIIFSKQNDIFTSSPSNGEINVGKGKDLVLNFRENVMFDGVVNLYGYYNGIKVSDEAIDVYYNNISEVIIPINTEYSIDYIVDMTNVEIVSSKAISKTYKEKGDKLIISFSTKSLEVENADSKINSNVKNISTLELIEFMSISKFAYTKDEEIFESSTVNWVEDYMDLEEAEKKILSGYKLYSLFGEDIDASINFVIGEYTVAESISDLADNGSNLVWQDEDLESDEIYRSFIGDYKIIAKMSKSNGLRAIALEDIKSRRIIISYTGTEEGDINDFITDGIFAFGFLPEHFVQAHEFYESVKRIDKYKNYKFVLTGHSLGGALASYVSVITDNEAHVIDGAVGHIIDITYFKEYLNITNFNGNNEMNFTNYTDKPSVLWADAIQYEVFKDAYHLITHETNNHKNPIKSHDVFSVVNYDDKLSLCDLYYENNPSQPNELEVLDAFDMITGSKNNHERLYLATSYPDSFTIPNKRGKQHNIIFGGKGDDVIASYGKNASDIFVGGTGIDKLDGGNCNDQYVFSLGDNQDFIYDISGNDKIIFKAPITPDMIIKTDSGYNGINYLIEIAGYSDSICISKKRSNSITNSFELVFSDGTVQKIQDWNSKDWSTRVIKAACPIFMEITDTNGNVVASITDEGPEVQHFNFGYLYRYEEGDETIKLAYLFDDSYSFKINGTGYGDMNLTVSEMADDGNIYESKSFSNIPISPETTINTSLDEETLNIDENGDGETDKTFSGQTITYPVSISIESSNRTLEKGEKIQLQAKINPIEVTQNNVSWFSSNEGIANVDQSGIVTAVSPGEVRITAITENDLLSTISVLVTGKNNHKDNGTSNDSGSRNTRYKHSQRNVNGDKEINKTKNTSTPTINLGNDIDGKTLVSVKTIKEMNELNKTITIENRGIKIIFKPESIPTNEDIASIVLGSKEITEEENIISKAKIGESTGLFEIGGKIFDLTANILKEEDGTKKEEKIERFNEPVEVTIDLSDLDLSEEDIEKLTAVRYKKDESGDVIPVKLGGVYNPKNKTFSFYTDQFSLYSVVKAQNLLEIDLVIGQKEILVNKGVKKNDVASRIINSRTMVPVRFIAENMGALVEWNEETRKVTIELDGQKMDMIIDKPIEGFDTPPTIVDNRTLVPVRYVSERLGANVMWFPTEKKVHIVK